MSYREEFRRYEAHGTWTAWRVVKWFTIFGLFVLLLGAIGNGLGWFHQATTVVAEEFSPREMLRKYEWFKEASAQLDKKQADIALYHTRMAAMPPDRATWDRTDKETFAQWQSELLGVTASYNALAADYNAQMAKINWRFANAGMLPQGATEPLPREFKPYEVTP